MSRSKLGLRDDKVLKPAFGSTYPPQFLSDFPQDYDGMTDVPPVDYRELGRDLRVPGSFIIRGYRDTPPRYFNGRKAAMDWALSHYGKATLAWEVGSCTILTPGVLWSTVTIRHPSTLWAIRVSTMESLKCR